MLQFQNFGQMAQPPVWGYDKEDMGGPTSFNDGVGPTTIGASISASGGIQDLATGSVMVDTSVPLRGFLVGIAILVGIRVMWELMD